MVSIDKTIIEKQIVVFGLGNETYGIDIGLVREIIQMQHITRVPGTPFSVEGITNIRGTVIPVVSLRKRFKLSERTESENTRIVVVNCHGAETGIIVDVVNEVLRVPVTSIEPPAAFVTGENSDHVTGIVKLEKRLVILLDMEQILSQRHQAFPAQEIEKERLEDKQPANVMVGPVAAGA